MRGVCLMVGMVLTVMVLALVVLYSVGCSNFDCDTVVGMDYYPDASLPDSVRTAKVDTLQTRR